MKRLVLLLCFILLSTPAWCAKKITVAQLSELLHSLQQAKKGDAEVATELKQVELSEQMTRATMNSLVSFVPGPYSTEQIYVLEAKSAILAPPAADLPATPALDAAAQTALLAKVMEYSGKVYAQLPHLTAAKVTARFQDSMEAVSAGSGMNFSAHDVSVGSGIVSANKFVHYINSTEAKVESQNGIEKLPSAKDKTPWGANGMIALEGQGPVLSTVLSEAQAAGHIAFLRWETVNGKPAAVFTYAVDKKKSRYAVLYCCFPDVEQTGSARYGTAGGSAVSAAVGVSGKGNVQTNTDWHTWKSTVPYHGEFFVDPETGVVVRLIVQADFKSSDVVHQEDQRIDYAAVKVDGKVLVVPMHTVVSTEVVQNGESFAGGYNTRHTLFTSEYKDYAPAE